jgi:Rod binding domain-containing protein
LDPRRGVKEIEGFFIGHLLKVMRQTVPKGLFGSSASEQFNYFFDQEIGRLAAESGTFGLAAMVEADLQSKGLTITNTNGLSSTPGLPIQGPSESVIPPTPIGPHTEKG